jgi:plastocyanin
MEQSPKPAEAPAAAPKPKNRNMLLAVIIVVILVVVGVSVYFVLTPPPSKTSGTPVTIWDQSPTCAASPASCGFSNNTGTNGGTTLTIKVGTTVTWTNNGGLQHTVTACVSSNPSYSSAVTNGGCPGPNASGLPNFDSGTGTPINPGKTYSFTFNTAGVYNYYCQFHPWMHGTINVTSS